MGLPSIFLPIDTKRDLSGKKKETESKGSASNSDRTFDCTGDGTLEHPFQLDHEAIRWGTGLKLDEEIQMLCKMKPEDQKKLRDLDQVSDNTIPANYFMSNEHLCITKLPKTIKKIGSNAFARCTNLNIKEWPASLQSIGSRAFEATAVVTLEFNNSTPELLIIHPMAFVACTKLTSVKFYDESQIRKIYPRVFRHCNNLTTVKWPKELETIGAYAFEKTAVKELDFPTNLKTVQTTAFKTCINLETVRFPGTIKAIGSEAFMDCTALTKVEFTDKGSSRDETDIFHDVFKGCTMLKEKTIQLPPFTNIVTQFEGGGYGTVTDFSDVDLQVKFLARELEPEPIPTIVCCAQTLRKHIMSVDMRTPETDPLFVDKMAAYFATKFVVAVSPCYNHRYMSDHDTQIGQLYLNISTPETRETVIQTEMFLLSEAKWKLPCGMYQKCTDTSKSLSIGQIYKSVLNDLKSRPEEPSSTTVEKKSLPTIHTRSSTMELPACSPTTTTNRYRRLKRLGGGTYGDVEEFVDTGVPDNKVAIKWVQCNADDGDISSGIAVEVVNEVIIGNYVDSYHVVKPKCAYLAKSTKRLDRQWMYYVGIVMNMATSDLRKYSEVLNTWEQNHKHSFGWEPRQKIMRDVLNGLNAMHNKGLAHSDFKPEQILITYDEQNPKSVTAVVIGDLGSVQFTGTDQHRPNSFNLYGELVTTRYYIAPETMLFQNYGNKCDMWAAGLVFSELYLGDQGNMFSGIKWEIINPMKDWLPVFSANVLDFKGWHDYWEENYQHTDKSRFYKTNWLTEENLGTLNTREKETIIPKIKERLKHDYAKCDNNIIVQGEWLALAAQACLQPVDVLVHMKAEFLVICGLLVADPSKRLSAEDALKQLNQSPTQGSTSTVT